MRGVFIYFQLLHHSASTYAQYVWQELLPVVFAEPLTNAGTSVFQEVIDRRVEFFQTPPGFLTSECLTSDLCFSQMQYSRQVRIFDPIHKRDEEIKCIDDFDFIMIAAFNGYYQYINWLRKQLPDKPIILVQDDAIEELQYCHSSLQGEALNAMHSADGFISYQREMTELARALCHNTIAVHHPMLPGFAPSAGTAVREKDLICIGVGCWNYDFMNLLTAISTLRRLRRDLGPGIRAEFLGVHEYQITEYEPYFVEEDISLKEWSKFGKYYEDLARYDVIFNLNGRAVAGRVSAEAACVATPVIGNVLADMQEYIWPELSIGKYNAHEAYLLCKRLLREPGFRRRQVQLAKRKIGYLKKECSMTADIVSKFIQEISGNKRSSVYKSGGGVKL